MKDPLSRAFKKELDRLLSAPHGEQKLKALAAKRNLLLEYFWRNPARIQLALEIKLIDDQIAECAEKKRMERAR